MLDGTHGSGFHYDFHFEMVKFNFFASTNLTTLPAADILRKLLSYEILTQVMR